MGKAVKIGHGPATVSGETPQVRTPSQTVVADALREKERGVAPHFSRGAFFIGKNWTDEIEINGEGVEERRIMGPRQADAYAA